jgi:hypothetical protein
VGRAQRQRGGEVAELHVEVDRHDPAWMTSAEHSGEVAGDGCLA